jgi:hypothetical protein
MKPKIKILFCDTIALPLFFSQQKNNNKNLKLRLKVRVTSLLEKLISTIVFLENWDSTLVYSMKQLSFNQKMLNLKITAIILEGIVLKKNF